jgi:uncharacterized membrane protein
MFAPDGAIASPLKWEGVPHARLQAGVIVTTVTSGAVACLTAWQAFRTPSARTVARFIQLTLAILLALISLTGLWLLVVDTRNL